MASVVGSPRHNRRSSSTPNLREAPVPFTHVATPPQAHISPPRPSALPIEVPTAPPGSTIPTPSADVPDPQQNQEWNRVRDRRQGWRWRAIQGFFGFGARGNVARKRMWLLIYELSFLSCQMIAIGILVAEAVRSDSPTYPDLKQWKACDKPLDVWCLLWAARLIAAATLALASYRASKRVRGAGGRPDNGQANSPQTGAAGQSAQVRDDASLARALANSPEETPPNASQSNTRAPRVVYSRTFQLMATILSFSNIAWFLGAHVLLYTSLDTCRYDAPYLWWLNFGLMALSYIWLAYYILIAFVVLILGPLLYVLLNLILICLGRSPLTPGYINPEVPKLSQKIVDRIPLVIYIPPPPETTNETQGVESGKPPAVSPPVDPNPTYPPKPPKRRSLFRFIRRKKARSDAGAKGGNKDKADELDEWEQTWEKGEWPFVKLEANRAACAICLMDFEEPRKKQTNRSDEPAPTQSASTVYYDTQQSITEMSRPENETVAPASPITGAEDLRLQAGEGQPLRLLACGHVFHKTCLDPWLIEVSGRCPVCQRPVEVPESKGDNRRRRRMRDG